MLTLTLHVPDEAQAVENRCDARSRVKETIGIACESDADVCRVWRQFRDAHPLPYQTLAVHLESAGDAIVIISEPPPIATPRELTEIVAAMFGESASVKRLRFPVGHDGWLEDIVVRVKGLEGPMVAVPAAGGDSLNLPNELADRLQYLSSVLFSTADGFYVDKSPGAGRQAHRPLDKLTITDTDLQHLMSDASVTWTELGGADSPAMSWQKALQVKRMTAVLDSSSVVVALVIPPKADLASASAEFRRFAVSTDYLVGALGPPQGGTVLFGRSRVLPLDVMPPLRFETLLSLSTTLGLPLAQSYERQRIFAGKLTSGPFDAWDWAPIFLSPQLQDSEFGTLLNLADQQLKSWSERGNIRYARFDIPEPSNFPFGQETASGWFKRNANSLSLIFNWNTSGYGRAVDGPLGRIVSASSLTALPMSYIPSTQEESDLQQRLASSSSDARPPAEQASKIGSLYFAELGDPILARVARNTFLYQALSATQPAQKSKAPIAAETKRSLAVSRILTSEVARWLQQALSAGPQRNSTVVKLHGELRMPLPKAAELIAAPQANTRAIVKAATTWRSKLQELQELVRDLPRMQIEVEVLAEPARRAFIKSCTDADGKLSKTRSGITCSIQTAYPGLSGRITSFEEMQYTWALDRVKDARSTIERNKQILSATTKTLHRLVYERQISEKIADELRARTSMDSELALVLERVLNATSGTASQTSIQTPSVVLSCNTVNLAMVGGHNIDPIPDLASAPPPLGTLGTRRPSLLGSGTMPELNLRIQDPAKPTAPARPLAEAFAMLAGRPTGSFLERMQTRPAQALVQKSAVFERAQLCNCDVYVERGEDGTVNLVRLGPPPVMKTVFGSSSLVQRLAETRQSERLLFAGFSRERAAALTMSAAQRAKRTPSGASRPLAGALRGAKVLFRNVMGRAQTVLKINKSGEKSVVAAARGDMSRQQLQVLLDSRPPWKDLNITKARANGALIEVAFPSQMTGLSGMEIRTYGAEGQTHRSPQLSNLAANSVRLMARSNPQVQQVVDRLGARLALDPNVQHVEFFLKDVGSVVRLQRTSDQTFAQVTIVR